MSRQTSSSRSSGRPPPRWPAAGVETGRSSGGVADRAVGGSRSGRASPRRRPRCGWRPRAGRAGRRPSRKPDAPARSASTTYSSEVEGREDEHARARGGVGGRGWGGWGGCDGGCWRRIRRSRRLDTVHHRHPDVQQGRRPAADSPRPHRPAPSMDTSPATSRSGSAVRSSGTRHGAAADRRPAGPGCGGATRRRSSCVGGHDAAPSSGIRAWTA
jgi:hypothetical protein